MSSRERSEQAWALGLHEPHEVQKSQVQGTTDTPVSVQTGGWITESNHVLKKERAVLADEK